MRNRSRFGWIELIEGILLIILGIFSFLRPDSMLSGFVMFFGLIALCIGILDIIFYVRTEEHVGFAPTIALMSGCLSVPCWSDASCISWCCEMGFFHFSSRCGLSHIAFHDCHSCQ